MDIGQAIELHEKLLDVLEEEIGHDEFYILITKNNNGNMMIEVEALQVSGIRHTR